MKHRRSFQCQCRKTVSGPAEGNDNLASLTNAARVNFYRFTVETSFPSNAPLSKQAPWHPASHLPHMVIFLSCTSGFLIIIVMRTPERNYIVTGRLLLPQVSSGLRMYVCVFCYGPCTTQGIGSCRPRSDLSYRRLTTVVLLSLMPIDDSVLSLKPTTL